MKEKEKEIPQIFCMRGSNERAEEVRAEFKKEGANNVMDWGYKAEDCIYYIDHGSARCVDKSNILYDLLISTQTLHELPSKEIEFVEGEVCSTANMIFIYGGKSLLGAAAIIGYVKNEKKLFDKGSFLVARGSKYTPATEEEKQLLFDAIDKAGYVFDKETLSLKIKKEKTEAKFDIGQDVWFAINYKVMSNKIDGILIRASGITYSIQGCKYEILFFKEHELFATKQELLDSL